VVLSTWVAQVGLSAPSADNEAMFVIGSIFPSLFLDKYGRRKPMMWGSFGLGISMMLISILLSFQSRGGSIAQATSSASVTFFFTVSFNYAFFFFFAC
jgi:hypothetical protein